MDPGLSRNTIGCHMSRLDVKWRDGSAADRQVPRRHPVPCSGSGSLFLCLDLVSSFPTSIHDKFLSCADCARKILSHLQRNSKTKEENKHSDPVVSYSFAGEERSSMHMVLFPSLLFWAPKKLSFVIVIVSCTSATNVLSFAIKQI